MISAGLFEEREDGSVSTTGADVIGRFLNRILGMTVAMQNAVFECFALTLEARIKEAKKLGEYDPGILGTYRSTVEQSYLLSFSLEKKKLTKISFYIGRPVRRGAQVEGHVGDELSDASRDWQGQD